MQEAGIRVEACPEAYAAAVEEAAGENPRSGAVALAADGHPY